MSLRDYYPRIIMRIILECKYTVYNVKIKNHLFYLSLIIVTCLHFVIAFYDIIDIKRF